MQNSGGFASFTETRFYACYEEHKDANSLGDDLVDVNGYIMLGAFECKDNAADNIDRFKASCGVPRVPGLSGGNMPLVTVTVQLPSTDGTSAEDVDGNGNTHIITSGVNIPVQINSIGTVAPRPDSLGGADISRVAADMAVNANQVLDTMATVTDATVVNHIAKSWANALLEAAILIAISATADMKIKNIKSRCDQKKLVIDHQFLLDLCMSYQTRSAYFRAQLLASAIPSEDAYILYRMTNVSTPALLKMVYESRGVKKYWDRFFPQSTLIHTIGQPASANISEYIIALSDMGSICNARSCDQVPKRMIAHIQIYVEVFDIEINKYYQGESAVSAMDQQEVDDIMAFYRGIRVGDKDDRKGTKMRHTLERAAHLENITNDTAVTRQALRDISDACDELSEEGIVITEANILNHIAAIAGARAARDRSEANARRLYIIAIIGAFLAAAFAISMAVRK